MSTHRRLLRVTVSSLALLLSLSALPGWLVARLEAQAGPLVLQGHVESVEGWLIHTTIPTPAALRDGDFLQVQLGGRQLVARFVSAERYAQLATDADARATLDVDIVCTGDGQHALTVAPLGGDLTDMVALTAATPVVVTRP